MADWLSFIIFALLFYFMMRHGCGSHLIHGHHGKKGEQKHLDPVCGKKVDTEKGYGKMHEGNLYRFCSRECLDQFETEPDKYIKQST
ncbi:hypothetical protein MNBD_GAMMA23-794 [hydrothermal vent metagenome]|uniref:TRASH domain-containing protein n=1 Tax=hydrothermal vent metagenome TaxID=652676 RepID=A0A3B1A434_9ZZZZ